MPYKFIIATIIAITCSSAYAQDLTVDQIVDKANHVAYYQGADGRAVVHMNIVDAQGRTREREMTILRYDVPNPDENTDENELYAGPQKFYVYFHQPADVSKMAFLVWKHLDKDDDRWLYLPKIDLVKRIAGSEKRTSFVGSDFFYEDISGRNIDYDTHELIETTNTYYILKSTPLDPDSVEFAYYKNWIHKSTFLVVKTEYYDARDQPYRRYEAKAVNKIQDFFTVTKSRMTDLQSNRYTEITNKSVKYNVGLTDDLFTERYLRNPPAKHLKD